MSKRPKLGDVIEISLANAQFGYAQYTHKHPQYGALLRVFDIREKVTDSSSFFSNGILFSVFFPLGATINRNIVSVVANLPIPSELQSFPTFRAGTPNKQGSIESWWLWDGEKEWRVGTLNPEQMKYPIRGVINDTLLVERIKSGWRG